MSTHGVTPILSPSDSLASPGAVSRPPNFAEHSPANPNNLILNTQGQLGSSGSSSSTSMDPGFQSTTRPSYGNGTDGQLKSAMYATAPKSMLLYESSSRQPYESYDGQQYSTMAFDGHNMSPHPHSSDPANAIQARQMSQSGQTDSTTNPYMSSGGMVNGSNTTNGYIPHPPQQQQQQQQSLNMTPLPASGYSDPNLVAANNASIANAISNSLGNIGSVSGVIAPDSSMSDLESMAPYAHPVFGGETLDRSPFAMTDDFTAWLFNENSNVSSSMPYPPVQGMMSSYSDPFSAQLQNQYFPTDPTFYLMGAVPTQQPHQQHPMSVTSIIDSGPPHSIVSEEKRSELLDLIQTKFNETDSVSTQKRKEILMEGSMDSDDHILSLRMMQTYIGSYWRHCHSQLPILHKPTFVADKTPNLLLLAVMAIGASTLQKDYGQHMTDLAFELANFISWNLRWEIFRHADFRPPAKLWVFQTLLLLEVYEKMYSTRELHERAHIHHDTTLTLMRRGSSLIGHSAFDSPPSLREERQNRSTAESRTTSVSESSAGEESWARWVKAEATRRVAFAAFVLDSTHATMFGHSVKMVAHEMKLPLPCDEALWSAASAAEVARAQSKLNSNGVKPTMFLDGLKKTLNGQRVRTNSFGRTIIMAGLLSVRWHMNQRDLQVSSLGVSHALGGRENWRSSMLRAFDNWKRDFDEALIESNHQQQPQHQLPYPFNDDIFFESRSVLHHLAHMASHVDVIDCQIFAGAGRLLGRSITPKDYSAAREKMTSRWATRAPARDATFYALKFLSQVLLPDGADPVNMNMNVPEYIARDDFLMNRPWVLYFSALVVWCYGYALDGPITTSHSHDDHDHDLSDPIQQQQDMYAFLTRVGGIEGPDDLDRIRDRNQCMGLLMVLRTSFSKTRWELLNEASNLLGSCIEKLKGPVTAAAPVPASTAGP